jgi:hypothetical protein
MPELIINGPVGRLEARYHHAGRKDAPLAIVMHPHPEYGGTMNNAVTYTLYQTLVARGFSVMRFNYRGVGKSEGVFDKGEGELSDAAACLDWMQALNTGAPYIWVAGFSFGAWLGMQLLMRRPEIRGFISVSPPANMYDFTFLAPCPSSGLILAGGADTIVPPSAAEKLVQKLNMQKGIKIDYRIVDGANHFYHDHLETMTQYVHDHMNNREQGGNYVAVNLPGQKAKKAA